MAIMRVYRTESTMKPNKYLSAGCPAKRCFIGRPMQTSTNYCPYSMSETSRLSLLFIYFYFVPWFTCAPCLVSLRIRDTSAPENFKILLSCHFYVFFYCLRQRLIFSQADIRASQQSRIYVNCNGLMVLGLWYLHPGLLMRLTGSVNEELTSVSLFIRWK